ncbi:MAG: hypothetical protein JXR37_30430 [Kiritimatiellae bacterium]|nr:hypothetical protein [Kiritimatiellia bacterium]
MNRSWHLRQVLLGAILVSSATLVSAATYNTAVPSDWKPVTGYLPPFDLTGTVANRERLALKTDWGDNEALDSAPVTFGVPFPRNVLLSAGNARIVDARGVAQACQIATTATWSGKDGSVKWLLVDMLARKGADYALEYGRAVAAQRPEYALDIAEGEGAFTVRTGAAEFGFRRGSGCVIDHVQGTVGWNAGQPGDRMYLLDDRGVRYVAGGGPETEELVLEERGPLRAVVRRSGWYMDGAGGKFCGYVVRVHLYAGRPTAKILHTLVIGFDTNAHRLKDIGLPFPVGAGQAVFGLAERAGETGSSGRSPAGAGGASEPVTAGYLCQPQHDRFRLVGPDGRVLGEGARAEGWAAVQTRGGTVGLGLRHFREMCAKEISYRAGRLVMHLWAPHAEQPLDFNARAVLGASFEAWTEHHKWNREYANYKGGLEQHDQACGLARTHELILTVQPDAGQAAAVARSVRRPVLVFAPPEWMCRTDVFGNIEPYDPGRFPKIENAIRLGWERYAFKRRYFKDWGWIDYGDVHYKHHWNEDQTAMRAEPWRRWAQRFYGFHLVPYVLWARSGDRRYLDFAIGNTRHIMDVDTCHLDNAELRKSKGARYGGDGGLFHYAADLYFDLDCDTRYINQYWYFYLTGERRGLDVCEEMREYAYSRRKSGAETRYRSRHTGGPLYSMTEDYAATWDPRFRERADNYAGLLFGAMNSRGTTRHDDVYMNQGIIRYYQESGSAAMRELFLRNMRQCAIERDMDWTKDSRGTTIYGLAHAYLFTKDPVYLGYLGWQLDEFLRLVRDRGTPILRGAVPETFEHTYLATCLYQVPFALRLLAAGVELPKETIAEKIVTTGPIWFRKAAGREASLTVARSLLPGWPFGRGYEEHGKIAASYLGGRKPELVVRDGRGRAVLRRESEYETAIVLPAHAPAGDYELALDTPLPHTLRLGASSVPAVMPTRDVILRGGRHYYFAVPRGTKEFRLLFHVGVMRAETTLAVQRPDGTEAAKWVKTTGGELSGEFEPLSVSVPPGADGQVWRLGVDPEHRVFQLRLRFEGIPGAVTTHPDLVFVPARRRAEEPVANGSFRYVQGPGGGAARFGSKDSVRFPLGRKLALNAFEGIRGEEGTLELRIRPLCGINDVVDRPILECGRMRIYRRGSVGLYFDAGRNIQTGFPLPRNLWTHVAFTWEYSATHGRFRVQMFINGIRAHNEYFQREFWNMKSEWLADTLTLRFGIPVEVDDVRISDRSRAPQAVWLGDEQVQQAGIRTLFHAAFDGNLDAELAGRAVRGVRVE